MLLCGLVKTFMSSDGRWTSGSVALFSNRKAPVLVLQVGLEDLRLSLLSNSLMMTAEESSPKVTKPSGSVDETSVAGME